MSISLLLLIIFCILQFVIGLTLAANYLYDFFNDFNKPHLTYGLLLFPVAIIVILFAKFCQKPITFSRKKVLCQCSTCGTAHKTFENRLKGLLK